MANGKREMDTGAAGLGARLGPGVALGAATGAGFDARARRTKEPDDEADGA